MVTQDRNFLIDASFILERNHEAFLGAQLLVCGDENYTFLYGVTRDLLRLRQDLGILQGVLVVGRDSGTACAEGCIGRLVDFLSVLGMRILHRPDVSVLDLCAGVAPLASHVISDRQEFLQLVKYDLTVVCPDKSGGWDILSSTTVKQKFGIEAVQVPSFLALTTGPKSSIVTRGQARRLLELYSEVTEMFEDGLTRVMSAPLRDKLELNRKAILDRTVRLTATEERVRDLDTPAPLYELAEDESARILESCGLLSLVRLLRRPSRSSGAPAVLEAQDLREPEGYKVITDAEGLDVLQSTVLSAKVCAIDTEASDKDPRTATLFGVAFCVEERRAYYLPVVGNHRSSARPLDAHGALRKILGSGVRFVGHNIKYDYVLLRRNNLNIAQMYFDTMLAAHDCYGDLDSWSLGYLAERILGRHVQPYRELVNEGETFLDLPQDVVVRHACTDVDATLALYHMLVKELERRGVAHQYWNETIPLVKTLGDWEFAGVWTDTSKLASIRQLLLTRLQELRAAVLKDTGTVFDLDSNKELWAALGGISSLKRMLPAGGSGRILALERAACSHPIAKSVARYKRLRKELRIVDSVAAAVREGRVYPLFSQVRTGYNMLTSENPSIFDGVADNSLKSCFRGCLPGFFRDRRKAIGRLRELTGEYDSEKAAFAQSAGEIRRVIAEVGSEELLLSLAVGVSDTQLSKEYLIDRLTASQVRHEFQVTYPRVFEWASRYRNECVARGFAVDGGRVRHLDGLRSSNVARREAACNTAIRWLLRY
ncbi:MAG: hypothetical protein A3F90_10725 [Deltaproteobacteria bacterium RIFCSPLOWO2_12_FULL_60_19]|nr:MAG: hypothetical protein A3F90_10725 [Deltaproteobacteria bacterium RIFCSPLOWO2_12_FULL_60_19]